MSLPIENELPPGHSFVEPTIGERVKKLAPDSKGRSMQPIRVFEPASSWHRRRKKVIRGRIGLVLAGLLFAYSFHMENGARNDLEFLQSPEHTNDIAQMAEQDAKWNRIPLVIARQRLDFRNNMQIGNDQTIMEYSDYLRWGSGIFMLLTLIPSFFVDPNRRVILSTKQPNLKRTRKRKH